MKKYRWQIIAGITLLGASCLFYLAHYVFFRDPHHIFIFMVGDLAFLPVEVLLVTLLVDQLLKDREKRAMLNKLNMVVGIFFSKMGFLLLRHLASFDRSLEGQKDHLVFTREWTGATFEEAKKKAKDFSYAMDSRNGDLEGLRTFLSSEKDFLLTLLGNPNLLEHERFTDLLWAVTHLAEELAFRGNLNALAEADYNHISVDIKRAHVLLITEWLTYMGHLKTSYPHLFSLAERTNPFDPKASVEFA